MSVIKTGTVYQRTKKGPNYIVVGRANVNGESRIISVKNGNIRQDGKCKLSGKYPVVLHAHLAEDVTRVHQVRQIVPATVFSRGEAFPEMRNKTRRLANTRISAETPVLAELR